MAINSKFPLEYAVDITDKANENIDNYDILTVNLDRKIYTQEEIASFVNYSIDKILVANDESYRALSKEEVHKIDINKHRLIVKLPVNYNKHTSLNPDTELPKNIKIEDKVVNRKSEKVINGKINIQSEKTIYTSAFYSGISGYGLNLL